MLRRKNLSGGGVDVGQQEADARGQKCNYEWQAEDERFVFGEDDQQIEQADFVVVDWWLGGRQVRGLCHPIIA